MRVNLHAGVLCEGGRSCIGVCIEPLCICAGGQECVVVVGMEWQFHMCVGVPPHRRLSDVCVWVRGVETGGELHPRS